MIRAMTESGDYYSATKELWDAYHQAWKDNDMDLVMKFETGMIDDFRYDP